MSFAKRLNWMRELKVEMNRSIFYERKEYAREKSENKIWAKTKNNGSEWPKLPVAFIAGNDLWNRITLLHRVRLLVKLPSLLVTQGEVTAVVSRANSQNGVKEMTFIVSLQNNFFSNELFVSFHQKTGQCTEGFMSTKENSSSRVGVPGNLEPTPWSLLRVQFSVVGIRNTLWARSKMDYFFVLIPCRVCKEKRLSKISYRHFEHQRRFHHTPTLVIMTSTPASWGCRPNRASL